MDGGYKNFSFTAGGSYKDIGDLKPGKGYDIQLPSKKFLLTSQSNPTIPKDAWLVDVEKPTGWKEKDGDVKLNYRISNKQDIKLAYQGVRQENVPRYDRYATKEYDVLLFNPQNRDLTYLNYTAREITLSSILCKHRYHIKSKMKVRSNKKLKALQQPRSMMLQI